MRFSIVVVCLNAGEKLKATLESIVGQTFHDYEIVVKDGYSSDGSVEAAEKLYAGEKRLKVLKERDQGIYDAMNQAVKRAEGEYVLFLNCGDKFYERDVLFKTDALIQRKMIEWNDIKLPFIFYGDVYEELTRTVAPSNPKLDSFGCYRNVPCHQACFYSRELFTERGYDTRYSVRADYEHFLWCFFVKGAVTVHLPFVSASYEGGGFSETEKNRRLSAREHKEITRRYMSGGRIFCYKALLLLTLAPLRSRLARSKSFAGLYNRLKSAVYK